MMQTPVAQWVALSDHAGPVNAGGIADVMQSGSLVLELTAPKDGGSVLLDYRSDMGWPRAFSIFYDATAGIVIRHRQGGMAQRHHLPGPLPRDWGLARLTYSWDGPARRWSLRLEDTAGLWAFEAIGSNPIPLAGTDVLAFCAGQTDVLRDTSVQWFGVSLQTPSAPATAWIGDRTPVDTQRGRVAAGDLRLGDLIATLDHGHQPLRALDRIMVPNRGRFAAVLLRAPYFARQTDLLVAPRQLTLLSGVAVEYLFGEEAVLAPAAALRDGNSALTDARRPLTACIALDLGGPEVIFADGCPLLCGSDEARPALPYRVLQDYEALTLQSALGRGGRCAA
jgi:hypothetical protein